MININYDIEKIFSRVLDEKVESVFIRGLDKRIETVVNKVFDEKKDSVIHNVRKTVEKTSYETINTLIPCFDYMHKRLKKLRKELKKL